jgi:hypothetical protein
MEERNHQGKQRGRKQAMDDMDDNEGTDAFAAAFGIEIFGDDDFTFKDHPTDWRRKPWQR